VSNQVSPQAPQDAQKREGSPARPSDWRSSWRRFRREHPRARWIIPAAVVALAFSYPWWGLEGPLSSIFNSGLGIDNDTLFNMSVYVMLALGLNVVVGYAGLLDLGYVAFFALGAYTLGWFGSGLFFHRDIHFLDTNVARLPGIHLSFWVVVLIAGIICAIAGVIIGWPTLRLRGDYLAIVTLGFGEIIPDVFRNGDNIRGHNLTNGVRGITQLDRPGFGTRISDATGGVLPARFGSLELRPWYFTILIMMLITIFVNLRLRDSKMGRAWIAVREDEVAASAMGVPLMRTKLWAYGIGAIFGGFAGAVYGSFINGIFPTSFSFQISVIVLVMVIVGGMGNIWGVIAGAMLISWLNFRGLDKIGIWINDAIPGTGNDINIAKYKFGIFGGLLVIMMLFRPEGLIPDARREAEFEEGEGPQEYLYDIETDEVQA
jgi:branched-chain amino acid transport system permease protein